MWFWEIHATSLKALWQWCTYTSTSSFPVRTYPTEAKITSTGVLSLLLTVTCMVTPSAKASLDLTNKSKPPLYTPERKKWGKPYLRTQALNNEIYHALPTSPFYYFSLVFLGICGNWILHINSTFKKYSYETRHIEGIEQLLIWDIQKTEGEVAPVAVWDLGVLGQIYILKEPKNGYVKQIIHFDCTSNSCSHNGMMDKSRAQDAHPHPFLLKFATKF